MAQKKLPLINETHGTETRNIINEMIKIINDRGIEILSESALVKWLEENGINHREEVQSFGDLPNNDPLNTVRSVANDNKIYIKKEGGWVAFQSIDVSRINDVESRFNSSLKETVEKVSDYTLYPQSPKPEKKGIKERSAKIVDKITNDDLRIIQKTNRGYVEYILTKNNGASNPDRDYGVNHELLRLTRVRPIEEAYVYLDLGNPLVGAPLAVQHPSALLNASEVLITRLPTYDRNKTFSSKGTGGFSTYILPSQNEVSYNVFTTIEKKANVLFYCSAGSSKDVDILINDVVVKTFSPKAYTTHNGQSMALIEFEVPSVSEGLNIYKITIKNNGSSVCYPCCINFAYLKDYKNQHVDQYKCFGSTKEGWIENVGASDYAIHDSDERKWFGSFHGGEVSLYDRISWHTNYIFERNEYDMKLSTFRQISTGDWRVLHDMKIYQHTSLADGNAKMTSEFDFNTDGSLEMSFGYTGNLNVSIFHTALTSTNTRFSEVFMPIKHDLGTNPAGGYFGLELSEGYIKQVNPLDLLELDIRFTKFNQLHDDRGPSIADHPTYRKFYYGPVYGTTGVLISNVTFSKGLDFIVR